MRCRCIFLLFILFFVRSEAQVPDSVAIGNTWYYVYPIDKEVTPLSFYYAENRLDYKELNLYLLWIKDGEPKAGLPFRQLRKALRQTLSASDPKHPKGKSASKKPRGCVRPPSRKTRRREWKVYKDTLEMQVKAFYSFDEDIIPVPYDLPDGRYVQYYEPFSPIDKKGKIYIEPQHTAFFFELTDNTLNNAAVLFSYAGDTIKAGTFDHGFKTGRWSYSGESGMILSKKEPFYTNHNYLIDLKHGKLDGDYYSFFNSKLIAKGVFSENYPTGIWEEYGTNLLRFDMAKPVEMIPDDPILIMRDNTISYKISVDKRINYNLSIHCAKNDLLNDTLRNGGTHKYITRPMLAGYYDNDYIPVLTFRTFRESYYPNGQLIYRAEKKTGERFIEPVIYFENGKVYDSIVFERQTGSYKRFIFGPLGDTTMITTTDSTGKGVRQLYPKEKGPVTAVIGGLTATLRGQQFTYFNRAADSSSIPALSYRTWTAEDTILRESVYRSIQGVEHRIQYNFYGNRWNEQQKIPINDTIVRHSGHIHMGNLELTARSVYNRLDYYNIEGGTTDKVYIETGRNATDTLVMQINWNGIPYSGSFELNMTRRSYSMQDASGLHIQLPESYYRMRLHKRYLHFSNKEKTDEALGLPVSPMALSDFPAAINQLLLHYSDEEGIAVFIDYSKRLRIVSVEGKLENGLPEGLWTFRNTKGKTLLAATYSKGKLNGTVETWGFYDKSDKKKPVYMTSSYRNEENRKRHLYKKSVCHYANNRKNGTELTYTPKGDTATYAYYSNGWHEGPVIRRENDSQSYAFMKNRALNGTCTSSHTLVHRNWITKDKQDFITTTLPDYSLSMKAGKLNGEATLYWLSEGTIRTTAVFRDNEIVAGYAYFDDEGAKLTEGIFKDSALTGLRFFKDGWLSYTYEKTNETPFELTGLFLLSAELVKFGITYHKPFINTVRMTDEYLDDPEIPVDSVLFMKYFPNGNIARSGTLMNGSKTGLWHFSDYDGNLLYTIAYNDSLVKIGDSLTFQSLGIYSEYDLAGNVLSRRFVTEEQEKYDCSHDDHYAIRQYVVFEDAPDSTARTNGLLRNYYDNGVLQSEGMIVNGIPAGVWKIYSPDGKLHQAGNYVNGKRNGRWLSGDLSDQKYLGEICLDPDLEEHYRQEQINYLQNNLDIELIFYAMGTVETNKTYNWNKNRQPGPF